MVSFDKPRAQRGRLQGNVVHMYHDKKGAVGSTTASIVWGLGNTITTKITHLVHMREQMSRL